MTTLEEDVTLSNLRDSIKNLIDPEMIDVCAKCGDPATQSTMWVVANGEEDVGGKTIDSWCPTCMKNNPTLKRIHATEVNERFYPKEW